MNTVPPELDQAVRDVARRIELLDVRTAAFGARLLDKAPALGERPVVAIELNVLPISLDDERFVVEGQFSLKARLDSASEPFMTVELKVGAIYRHPAPLPSGEVLEAFATTNSMIHLWPYFRAFVQQSAAQLGVPSIVLAPFRVTPVPPLATDSQLQPAHT